MSSADELRVQRDRLIERFALMQSELGGLFYEMAIRDHVKLDVLVARAAALQTIDGELAQVEALLAAASPATNAVSSANAASANAASATSAAPATGSSTPPPSTSA